LSWTKQRYDCLYHMQIVGFVRNRLHGLIFSYVNKHKALAVLLKSNPNLSVNLWSQPKWHDDLNANNVTSCGICTVQFLLILPVAAQIKRCSVTQAWDEIQLGSCCRGRPSSLLPTSTCTDICYL